MGKRWARGEGGIHRVRPPYSAGSVSSPARATATKPAVAAAAVAIAPFAEYLLTLRTHVTLARLRRAVRETVVAAMG